MIYICLQIESESMQTIKPQLLIGGVASGSGKTTFTMGLLKLLRNRGLRVQPYKCGPDYIDTKYHTMAAGSESVNLDLWLSSPEHLKDVYSKYGREAEVCVAEGMMGLFDGYQAMKGSSAEIARLLHLPVILMVGARSTAYSVAPLIYGFKNFCPGLQLAGVIFNEVASQVHFASLREACEDVGVECLGYLPRMKELEVPSRHLGLTLEAGYHFDDFALKVASAIEAHVEVDKILRLCSVPFCEIGKKPELKKETGLKIAVACDEAFNFTYRENISRLRQWGEITYFSPLKDPCLPSADLVYLPGGYPEFFLDRLSANIEMRGAIRKYAENGGKLWAECGGMMYLCRSVTGMDGKNYPLAGVLPQEVTMDKMRLKLGYRRICYGPYTLKGHEFHYSSVVSEVLPSVAVQWSARDIQVDTPLYRYKNVIAGYTHIYWGEFNLPELWNI